MQTQSPGDRIRARRKQCQLTQKALAAKVGVSHVAISQWEKDETVPRGENLLRVAAALGCTPSWVFDGDGELFMLPSAVARSHAVPLISYRQAADWRGTALLDAAAEVDWLQSNMDLSGAAFAITITGHAMEPEFREGDTIIIDPAIKPLPGDFVVASGAENEAFFMKYRPRGIVDGEEIFELMPLNDDYPSLQSNQLTISLIGTLIEHRRYRQRKG